MRSKQNNQYIRGNNDDRYNRVMARLQTRNYQNLRVKGQLAQKDPQYRKHNSPDMNRYRTGTENRVNNNRRKVQDEEKDKMKRGRREEGQNNKDKVNGRVRELQKTSSTPNLVAKQSNEMEEENKDYLKLHEKLNLIESKLAQMKRNVQRKKQEKQQLLQEYRKRTQQRDIQTQKQAKIASNGGRKLDIKQFVTQVPEHKELHSFQQNPYSPKHNVYYISEIIKSYKDEKSLAREHLFTSLHIFKILQNSKFASDEEMKLRMQHLPKRAGFEDKKTVVFDLDETLIHCNDTLTPPYDVKLPITFPTGQVIEAGINIRPYTKQILRNLSQYFQIIVFTASHSCYANVVLDYLDPDGEFIHHRLYRQHCYQTPEGMYSKDLRVMNRQLSNVVLVDNAAYSYAPQPDNGIPILPYYHGKTDFELKALQQYLKGLVLVKDVRQINKKTFLLHKYPFYFNQAQKLVEQLYMQEENA